MDKARAWREDVVIPTYEVGTPEKAPLFLEKRVYQGSSGVVYPYPVIESISNEKTPHTYHAVFLENEYIKVMVLPELGGRIQMAYDKIRQRHFIYYNQVVKPALVGLAGPWISGGIEFNWPQHHRPSTFMPVDCTIEDNADGSVRVADTDINCWKTAGHGTETFEQILTNSCNPAFISIGQKLGKDLFCQYFEAFGLTERTGIDLPGETSSVYCPRSRMGEVELASSSFGQTNSLSPIEMITGYAAVINGGTLLKPYVVSKIVDKDGNVVMTNEKTVRRQVISADTSAEMRKALQAVVENNGGSNAYIKGYKIGGKSGTAQKLMGKYTKKDMKFLASYCCFAPADDPEIVMLIVADEPYGFDERYYGSTVAVPYARSVMEKALPYLGYYPQYTAEEAENQDIEVEMLIDHSVDEAKEMLEEAGMKCEVIGEGEIVNYQTPITGSMVSKGSTVLLYTGNEMEEKMTTVPYVTGLTMAEANKKLAEAGINYVAKGASATKKDVKVMLQSIPGGTNVERWSVISLDLGTADQSG